MEHSIAYSIFAYPIMAYPPLMAYPPIMAYPKVSEYGYKADYTRIVLCYTIRYFQYGLSRRLGLKPRTSYTRIGEPTARLYLSSNRVRLYSYTYESTK